MPSEHAEPDRPLPHLAPTPRRHGPRRDHLDPRNGRFLDPGRAVRFDGETLQPTAYAGDQLLVRPGRDGTIDPEVREALQTAAAPDVLHVEDVDGDLAELAGRAGLLDTEDHPLVLRVRLRRADDDEPRDPVDAWRVLQRFRRLVRGRHGAGTVSLMHLLTTGGVDPAPYVAYGIAPKPYVAYGVGGNPYVAYGAQPNPYVAYASRPDPYVAYPAGAGQGGVTAEYAQPGSGGRMPVTWLGPRPARRSDEDLDGVRRPVVAVLDTGTGVHPWLDDVVEREPLCGGVPIGLTEVETDVERRGVVSGRQTGSLDIEAGHGTFIAGLVHQRCPDARILSVRVVQPDGVVDEYDLLLALAMLWVRQVLALRENRPEDLVDVVSLSLGYYHEQPTDAAFDPVMRRALRALGRLGVVVVTSAGNDATDRPCYPAAFAPWSPSLEGGPGDDGHGDDAVPVVAVGATNPDGSVALFSNAGPWVRTWRPGAGLVSTVPTTFDGGRSPSVELVVDGQHRATIDPDDFRSGFATWSGTSFAAPVLAGDLAACLNESRALSADGREQADAVAAARAALRRVAPDA